MQISEFLRRLELAGCQPRRVGKGWQALCPAHADSNPSLSIDEGADGRVLIHCHAGCGWQDVLEALGLSPRDLFPQSNPFGDSFITAKRAKPRRKSDSRSPLPEEEAELRDKVYQELISSLTLERRHVEHLLSRGLTEEEVELLKGRGYRSLPADALERFKIAKKLAEIFRGDLLRVPGFYLTENLQPMFPGFKGGLLIPIRDVKNRIVGCQVRRDEAEEGGRYCWFSATSRGGISSGALIHVAIPEDPPPEGGWRRVWVAEGPLKADIAALRLKEPVIGIPGVSTWKAEGIDSIRFYLGAREVVIAFDADAEVNESVRAQQCRLADELLSWGARVLIAEWDLCDGKGLDDLLVGGGYPRLKPFKRAPDLSKVRSDAVRTCEPPPKCEDPVEATPELIERLRDETVSYTHLTLPTTERV